MSDAKLTIFLKRPSDDTLRELHSLSECRMLSDPAVIRSMAFELIQLRKLADAARSMRLVLYRLSLHANDTTPIREYDFIRDECTKAGVL